MVEHIDTSELQSCTCLRLRKSTRRVTQLFNRLLEPVGITSGQFALLAKLAGPRAAEADGLPMRTLADALGLDPTTLNRNLRPLASRGLLAIGADAADRRVRAVRITDAGRAKLLEALPYWRRAQARLDQALSVEARLALNGLLDLTFARLTPE